MSPQSYSQSHSAVDDTRAALAAAVEIIASQQAQIDTLLELVASQAARIGELERHLGLNSTNSGKPPSGDGPRPPPAHHQPA